ncbi:hemerythrin domain-containing protein [Microbacterium protaetiae]|uniref:Hemerythrin domain-containing protein n=1 Tax=Microbacterium protaetiae TaxID=2509458 RepID=A0A4P6E8T4_9MICO|nr:hemerythrin domain-containing protein [Microbacterium protaetiae]QAY58552.1 hemerythrin domain-containing protein [Microbacterium protaetiae]
MSEGTELADALIREHQAIDIGIETYLDGLDAGGDEEPLRTAMHALRRHIYLEEVFLFPPLRAGGMMMPILVMEREHGELWRAMDALEKTLQSPSDPEALHDACRSLLSLLESHNSKEEPIVYPRADADLSDVQRDQLALFLESGTFPEGWVCAKGAA